MEASSCCRGEPMAAYRPRGPFRANGSFFQNVLRWGSSARWFGVMIGVMALGLAFWSTTLLSDSPPHRLSLKRDAGPPRQPRPTINTDFYSPKVNVGCDCDCQIPDIPTDNSCDYFTETDISSMPTPERECPEFQSVPLRSSYTGGVLRVPGTGTVQVSTRDFDGFRDWANPKSTGGTPHEIDPQWQTHQLPLTLQLDSEFVRVRQLREDGEVEFQEVHSDPQRNPSVPPMPEAERAKKPNIVVFTVDALSRKDATSSMPRAMQWLKNIQKNNLAPKVAYTFSLAVTPGHATANSMTPFLMGRNWMLNELDEAKVATSRYENPDVQPDDHLTYHARKNGYRTLCTSARGCVAVVTQRIDMGPRCVLCLQMEPSTTTTCTELCGGTETSSAGTTTSRFAGRTALTFTHAFRRAVTSGSTTLTT